MKSIKKAIRSDAPGSHKKGFFEKLQLICISTVFIACLLPMYLLYLSNLSEMTFVSILKPVGISVLCGIVLYFTLQFVLHKSITFSCLFSAYSMLLGLNAGAVFKALRKLVSIYFSLVLTFLLVVFCLVLFWIFLRFMQRKSILRKLVVITFVTLTGMVLTNTVFASPKLILRIEASISTTPPPAAATLPEKRKVALNLTEIGIEAPLQDYMPNIYYFILDEYAAFDVLKKYYQYDNSTFFDFLEEAGFNVSLSSTCLNAQSELSIADIVTLNYIPESDRTLAYARKKLANALLYTELENLGYSLFQMSTKATIFKGIASLRDESLYNTGEPETEDGATVADVARDQSVLALFNYVVGNLQNTDVIVNETAEVELLSTDEIVELARGGYSGSIKNRLSVFDYFENASNYAGADKVAIFSYICCPHVPFLFQANGAPIEEGHRADWQNPQYYLGQFQYVTARMKNIVQAIIAEDPNSIIIIQSDHGVRWHEDCSQPHTFEISAEDELHILNAVYCFGQKMDIEGLSATNTMRMILTLYGLNYPQL